MYYLLLLHVSHCFQQLSKIVSHFDIRKSFPALQHVVHTQIGAEFEQDVHILLVLKVSFEFHHRRMTHCPMNLNLTHQLLLGSGLGKAGLHDHLSSIVDIALCVCELITTGKSAFSKELSLQILSSLVLPTLRRNLLVYNLKTSLVWKYGET